MENVIDQSLTARIKTDLFAILWKLQIQIAPEDFIRPIRDLGVDSLEYVELILEIEKFFSIHITNSEMDANSTFTELMELIEQKLISK